MSIVKSTDPPAVLVFGDSNTWGHDADTGCRFDSSTRFPGVVQQLLTTDTMIIHEQGLNGRTYTSDDDQCNWLAPNAAANYCNGRVHLMPILHSVKPVHVVVLALGVNDLKSRHALTPTDIANGCGLLIDDIRASGLLCPQDNSGHYTGTAGLHGVVVTERSKAPRIVVIAPPPITNEQVFPDFRNGGIRRSLELATALEKVCKGKNIASFINAGDIPGCVCNPKDGIHLTAEAHQALGQRVAEVLRRIVLDGDGDGNGNGNGNGGATKSSDVVIVQEDDVDATPTSKAAATSPPPTVPLRFITCDGGQGMLVATFDQTECVIGQRVIVNGKIGGGWVFCGTEKQGNDAYTIWVGQSIQVLGGTVELLTYENGACWSGDESVGRMAITHDGSSSEIVIVYGTRAD